MTSSTLYRDNADRVLAKSIDIHSPQCKDQILEIATILTPFVVSMDTNEMGSTTPCGEEKESDALSSNTISILPLGGGLSNDLFTVRDDGGTVLVRIHPEDKPKSDSSSGTERRPSLVDRELENKLVAWLSTQGIGPIFYGRFRNGRIEEFFSDVMPLYFYPRWQLRFLLTTMHKTKKGNLWIE